MTKAKVTVVISTSSYEKCFLDAILRECRKFADEIIVAAGDCLFDGTHEGDWYEDYSKLNTDVRFVCYEVTKTIEHNPLQRRPHAYWHNISRIVGASQIYGGTDWILFLDGDEVPEGDLVKDWLENTTLDPECSYKCCNYWYFRDVVNQATTWEDSVLLVPGRWFRMENLYKLLMKDNERDGLAVMFNLQRNVVHPKIQKPMFHHFSWVRSKEGLLRKVRNWGHKSDKDWERLIEEKWAQPFDGTDFVHGYNYTIVSNLFDIDVFGNEIGNKVGVGAGEGTGDGAGDPAGVGVNARQ